MSFVPNMCVSTIPNQNEISMKINFYSILISYECDAPPPKHNPCNTAMTGTGISRHKYDTSWARLPKTIFLFSPYCSLPYPDGLSNNLSKLLNAFPLVMIDFFQTKERERDPIILVQQFLYKLKSLIPSLVEMNIYLTTSNPLTNLKMKKSKIVDRQ